MAIAPFRRSLKTEQEDRTRKIKINQKCVTIVKFKVSAKPKDLEL